MEEENNNILGFGLFFFFIVLIVVCGSILIFLNMREKQQDKRVDTQSNEVIVSDKNKVEKDKDYIYYTEEETISNSLSLTSKYPVINLNSENAKVATEEIRNYVDEVKKTLKKNTENVVCTYDNEEKILETNYLDYMIYNYQEYITLFIRESSYSCENGFSLASKVKAYTFDVLTGKRLTTQEILSKYDTTLTKVIEKIQKNLKESQTVVNGEENIKIEDTINNLKENNTYAIYIDEIGDLIINYVVKTNSIDYNDTITINE